MDTVRSTIEAIYDGKQNLYHVRSLYLFSNYPLKS